MTYISNKDPKIQQAINVISSTYGDDVSVDTKKKSLLKFGRNDDVGTSEEMVWLLGGYETDAVGNSIDTISSSNAGDTQEVVVEGHTVSGSDLTKAHLSTDGSNNQSLKCGTSISSTDYWIVTNGVFSVNRQNSRSVDFKLQVRLFGKVWRTQFPFSVHSTGGGSEVTFDPPLIIPKNSDMRVVAISSGASTGVEASVNGYLAQVI